MSTKNTILITSIGKRVQLIKHLSKTFNIIGVDAGNLNPCRYFVDRFYKIPKAVDKNYISELLKICKKENVDLLIPLYEGEFSILNKNREQFQNINTKLMLSGKRVIDVCKDKNKTFEYFTRENIKSPRIYTKYEVEDIIHNKEESKFPLFIKPADGMGSSNAFKINNINELCFFKDYIKNGIIQDCIEGIEYTVDVLVGFGGQLVYIIPRIRLEVKSGEVVKSRTVKDQLIIDETAKVIEALNRLKDEKGNGTIGPLTIQFFKTNKDEIYLLEINPRFGGGVPLSFECGADYGSAMLNMLENKNINFENNFEVKTMLRFDDAVYINGD
ncbi:MAG: ATP-grasp domain-containing protein [Clostridium neonatale]